MVNLFLDTWPLNTCGISRWGPRCKNAMWGSGERTRLGVINVLEVHSCTVNCTDIKVKMFFFSFF